MPDIDLLREWGCVCEDPTCTAAHVDIESLPNVVGVFIEETD